MRAILTTNRYSSLLRWAILGIFVYLSGCAEKSQDPSYEDAVADYERELRVKETYDAAEATKELMKQTREAAQRNNRDQDKSRNADLE